jgi:hypothetical protein
VLSILGHGYSLLAQQDAARVFDRWKIPYRLVPALDWGDLLDVGTDLLSAHDPSTIVTGTSWGPSVDKAVTLAARKKKVPVTAIVEHWDLYMERFSELRNGHIIARGCFMPDRIWVNDALARDEACAAGLPPSIVEVLGQPHLEHQIQQFNRGQWRRDDTNIVFISERVGGDFVKGSPLYRGFDEYSVVDQLIKSIDLSRFFLTIKLHPQESVGKFDALIDGRRRISVLKDADNVELICNAGKVIGMFSMLLLEAALVRDDVVSFLPGGNPSLFVGNRIGATTPAVSSEQLSRLMNAFPTDMANNTGAITAFGAKFIGSAERMAQKIAGYLQ